MLKKCLILLLFLSCKSFALPAQINTSEKIVVVSPTEHRWGAYDASGHLVREGVASAGADFCPDMNSECHTDVGQFRIRTLGGANYKSPTFPMPRGGGPMPYCMYFNANQALHGYPHVSSNRNASHGCVRLSVSDAAWLRYHFVEMGTLVEIEPY